MVAKRLLGLIVLGQAPPADPETLAEGILSLYRMAPEKRRRLGASGRAYVEKHHDIRVLGQRLTGLIEEVAGDVAGS